jgi:hypothetical protein
VIRDVNTGPRTAGLPLLKLADEYPWVSCQQQLSQVNTQIHEHDVLQLEIRSEQLWIMVVETQYNSAFCCVVRDGPPSSF